MPDLEIPETFTREAHAKPAQLAAAIARTVQRLGQNPRHPGLQTHPVHGTTNPKVFEAYVDMKNRVTWHWGEGGRIVLLAHCNHDILKNPYG